MEVRTLRSPLHMLESELSLESQELGWTTRFSPSQLARRVAGARRTLTSHVQCHPIETMPPGASIHDDDVCLRR